MNDDETKPTTADETPPPREWPTEPRRLTDEELRTFVDDLVSGRVYTTLHIPQGHQIEMVFMTVALGSYIGVPEAYAQKIGILWEYIDKAGPLPCNGQPSFFSHRELHVDDWVIAHASYVKEIERRKGIELVRVEP